MFKWPVLPLIQGLIDILYPPFCLLCHASLVPAVPSPVLCPECLRKITRNHPPFCRRCSRPLKNAAFSECLSCRRRTPGFDHAWAACLYTEPIQQLVHLMKYGRYTGLRHLFTELILEFLAFYHIELADYDWLIPVPLHPTRLRERGFNQSLLIASLLSRRTGLAMNTKILYRSAYHPNQARVDAKQRWTNTSQAFRIKPNINITNKNLLVLDDLLTTGATASAIASTLKHHGARQVDIITLAIAAQPRHTA